MRKGYNYLSPFALIVQGIKPCNSLAPLHHGVGCWASQGLSLRLLWIRESVY